MAVQIRGPKPHCFTFTAQCMTKDNQIAKVTIAVNYKCAVKMEDWMYARTKKGLERAADDYVIEKYLYDVTTDRNPAKDLVKQMAEIVKASLKLDPKPTPSIKLEEILVTIRRERH